MGAGTDVIKIRGVEHLHGTTYAVIPDQIEAGTFMVAVAATKGDVLIKNVIPKHLESITQKLAKMKPENVGRASRISGVSPADCEVLLVYLEQRRRQNNG